jgi:DNA-binding transcriptional LysR family regulator
MDLGQLKTFVTVAAEHSFSLAAIKLCRTQPAVSQAIRRLEEDLGERLFDRSAKQPTLTRAGDALLPEAIRLLRMANEVAATIRQLSQRARAVLRIGGDEAAAHVLLPALSIFLARQPHVSIEFRRVADGDTLGDVGAGTIDIGVTTRERVPAPLLSVQVPVLAAGFCVLLPTRHPFASQREVPMTILHSARLVTLADVPLPTAVSTGATTDSTLATGSFLIMPGVDSLKEAVAKGLGIGIVPRAAVSSLTAHAGLVVIIPLSAARAASALTLVYRDHSGQPNAAEDFVEVLRSMGEDHVSRKAPIALRVSR